VTYVQLRLFAKLRWNNTGEKNMNI